MGVVVHDATTIAKGLKAAEPAPKAATGAGDLADNNKEDFVPGIVVRVKRCMD